jgi:hypothetical protein
LGKKTNQIGLIGWAAIFDFTRARDPISSDEVQFGIRHQFSHEFVKKRMDPQSNVSQI